MKSVKKNWQADDLAVPQVRSMRAYVPGMQPEGGGWIKLNTNELPYQPSPTVATAVAEEVAKLRLYPNPTSRALREFLAAKHGVSPDQVFFGNGCDEILAVLMRVFADGANAAGMSQPSYTLYPVLAKIQAAAMETIPFGRDMVLPVEAIAASKAKLFFLTSPNAPTGVEFSVADIRRAAQGFSGVFVIDETYADFAGDNCVRLLAELPNVVIARSMSKSYGLAGARAGYALASAEIIALMDKVRDSYNASRLDQAAALAALRDEPYHARLIAKIVETRRGFLKALRQRDIFVHESGGNFVFAEPSSPSRKAGAAAARSCYEFLKENRILVRYFPDDALTESFLRISIGLPEDMLRLLEVLDTWRKNA
jgi:histidinol-phosphate aminotransferase